MNERQAITENDSTPAMTAAQCFIVASAAEQISRERHTTICRCQDCLLEKAIAIARARRGKAPSVGEIDPNDPVIKQLKNECKAAYRKRRIRFEDAVAEWYALLQRQGSRWRSS